MDRLGEFWEISIVIKLFDQVYRGKLIEAEDNTNSQMANITVTYRDVRVALLENICSR